MQPQQRLHQRDITRCRRRRCSEIRLPYAARQIAGARIRAERAANRDEVVHVVGTHLIGRLPHHRLVQPHQPIPIVAIGIRRAKHTTIGFSGDPRRYLGLITAADANRAFAAVDRFLHGVIHETVEERVLGVVVVEDQLVVVELCDAGFATDVCGRECFQLSRDEQLSVFQLAIYR